MSLFIVSDFHIRGPDDPLYFSLLALVRDRARQGDTVVFAGDVFDLFVGNKEIYTLRYREFFLELGKAAQRGVKLHYIEGNHDFLIRHAFREIPDVIVHPHDFSVEIQGKRFYVAHGDTIDRKDYGYLLLRAFFRSPIMKLLIILTPGWLLDRFGTFSSHRSRKAKPALPADLPLKRREYLRKTYRNYAAERLAQGFDYVILGHCHDLDEMSFLIGGRKGQYVNVGYPRAHGSFLYWSPGEERIQREKLPG